MSRYYVYDSYTDSVAEFARGMTPGMLGKMAGNSAKKAQAALRTRVGLGLAGLGATGAAGYGGYKLLTRGKKQSEPAPADTSLKGRIKSLIGGAKSRASSAKAGAKARVGRAYENASASVVRSGLRGNARQGSAAAKKQYNKMTASARNQYAKLRGRGEG